MEYKTDTQSVNFKDAKKSYINTNLSHNSNKPDDKVSKKIHQDPVAKLILLKFFKRFLITKI